MAKKLPLEGEILKKRVRRDNYEPWMCEELVKVAEEGGHVAQMCLKLGIASRDTFYRWTNEHPEFGEAYEASKLASQAFYENVLLMGGLGRIKGYNFQSIVTILNNKFPTEYKRVAGSGTEINIGSINTIEQLDNSALDAKIDLLQKKLGLLPLKESLDDSDVLQDQ